MTTHTNTAPPPGAGAATVTPHPIDGCGDYSPIVSASTASPVELQVLDYRDRWTAIRADCAARCDMRGVAEAQDHIKSAGRMLVKIAAGQA